MFSYEDVAFIKQMELDMAEDSESYRRLRATFIGDTLYLLSGDGKVRAYSRESGELVEKL